MNGRFSGAPCRSCCTRDGLLPALRDSRETVAAGPDHTLRSRAAPLVSDHLTTDTVRARYDHLVADDKGSARWTTPPVPSLRSRRAPRRATASDPLRAPESLSVYVREALARGGERAEIAAAARDAGWAATETEAALAAWVDAPGLPPVSRPPSAVSARDAFCHGLMFFALLLVATHLGLLAFALIDHFVPDPLEGPVGSDGRIRWSISVLLVAWPVWAATSLGLARDAERDPGQRRSAVGHWLTWVALFLAAATLVGDAIAIVVGFLGGDLTPRFLLKSASVALIAGAFFVTYGRGRSIDDTP